MGEGHVQDVGYGVIRLVRKLKGSKVLGMEEKMWSFTNHSAKALYDHGGEHHWMVVIQTCCLSRVGHRCNVQAYSTVSLVVLPSGCLHSL